MSHIYPIEGQKHFDLHAELTDLGGQDKQTFRLAFAWDGEHFMEVTDDTAGVELYRKWIELHGGAVDDSTGDSTVDDPTDGAGDGDEDNDDDQPPIVIVTEGNTGPSKNKSTDAVQSGGVATAGSSNASYPEKSTQTTRAAGQDVASSSDQNNTDNASAEPPENESADESPAAIDAPDVDATESTSDTGSTESKSGSSTSGTPRKRSAKNSTRRS